jgi:hypothetical protein
MVSQQEPALNRGTGPPRRDYLPVANYFHTLPSESGRTSGLEDSKRKYNKNKRGIEKALLCPSPLRTLVRLPYFPPLSNLSNPCLQLSGPWFMEELRAAVRPLLSPISRCRVFKSTVWSSFIVTVTPSCITAHNHGGSPRSQCPSGATPLSPLRRITTMGIGMGGVRDRVLPKFPAGLTSLGALLTTSCTFFPVYLMTSCGVFHV